MIRTEGLEEEVPLGAGFLVELDMPNSPKRGYGEAATTTMRVSRHTGLEVEKEEWMRLPPETGV